MKAQKLTKVATELGFTVSEPVSRCHEWNIELKKKTPMGCEWVVPIWFEKADDITKKLKKMVDEWDSDNEASSLINYTNITVCSIRELMEDQEWKQEQLDELLWRLSCERGERPKSDRQKLSYKMDVFESRIDRVLDDYSNQRDYMYDIKEAMADILGDVWDFFIDIKYGNNIGALV